MQRRNFEREKTRLAGSVLPEELDACAHRSVAIPEIAGHPAGAAVDVRPVIAGRPLDCGTPIWEFSGRSYSFSPRISRQARDTRMLLRSAMLSAGFAPFDGEWWHFSYGDKEWAAYYGQPKARYDQFEFTVNQAT